MSSRDDKPRDEMRGCLVLKEFKRDDEADQKESSKEQKYNNIKGKRHFENDENFTHSNKNDFIHQGTFSEINSGLIIDANDPLDNSSVEVRTDVVDETEKDDEDPDSEEKLVYFAIERKWRKVGPWLFGK